MFDYELVVACGASTAVTLTEDSSFATTYAPASLKTVEMVSGQTTQDVTFPAWTASVCQIVKYELDDDAVAGITAPAGVVVKAGCAQPCTTLTITTTAAATLPFYVFVTAEGGGNTIYSTPAQVKVVCGP